MSKAGQIKKLKLTQSEDLSENSANQNQNNHQTQETKTDKVEHKNIVLDILKFEGKGSTQSQKRDNMFDSREKKLIQEQIDYQQLPSPLDSDEGQQSRQAQYLSYLVNTLPAQESQNQTQLIDCNLREKLSGNRRQQFLSILYLCAVYVKKNEMRTATDDQLLVQRLAQHITIEYYSRSTSTVGEALLANGYVVSAYCILRARMQKSYSVLDYMLSNYLQSLAQIQENIQEFLYISGLEKSNFFIAETPKKQKKQILKEYNQDESEKRARTKYEYSLKRSYINQFREQFKQGKKQTQISSENHEDCFQEANKLKATMATYSEIKSKKKDTKQIKSPKL